jgi:glycosyltransferase involved in cell wall biosynthesis
MDDKKICFIWNVSEERKFDESLKYVQALSIPKGHSIEIVRIDKSANPTEEFNAILLSSNAKYKVFIDESTLIIDKHFLFALLDTFRSNEKIGMIGAIGSKQIEEDSTWVASNYKVGSVYALRNETLDRVSYTSSTSYNFEQAAVLDQAFLATQYDIPFDKEKQKYDIAQSIKFIKNGYQIGVLTNDKPLLILDRPLSIESHNHTLLDINFVNGLVNLEVSVNVPLVSILIPTYNRPRFFELALLSALYQTYANIEIVIADDSTDDLTEKLVKEKYLPYFNHIRYFKNKNNLGQFSNDLKLFELAKGEYVNFLMDDDLFHSNKINKMMKYYLDDLKEEISLITSHREIINHKGELSKVNGIPKVFEEDTVLDGLEFGNIFLKNNFNFIGEPTTALFRKKDLTEPFGTFAGRKYGCNVDTATWLTLLAKGKGVYISETLSYFRIHSDQQLQTNNMKVLGATDYAHQVLFARSKGFLSSGEDYKNALKTAASYGSRILEELLSSKSDGKEITREKNKSEYYELREYINHINQVYKKVTNEFEEKDNSDLPLVSILIPSFNQTRYLKEALESALNQTYPNIEIIIGDDSTNNEVEKFIEHYLKKYNNIIYFKNRKDSFDFGYKNHVNLLEMSSGEFVNYLNHDDILHPEKIERMINCFFKNPNITLVTSVRQPIDEHGNKLPVGGAFSQIFEKDTFINGYELCNIVISNLKNFIGEPTTVLFKKSKISKYGYFNQMKFLNIADVANWFTLLQYGDAAYLTEPLSYFRVHDYQNSNKPELYIKGIVEWYQLIITSYKKGIIQNTNDFKSILTKWLTTFIPTINKLQKESNNIDNVIGINGIELLESCFKEAIEKVLSKN